ncbi:MAG TPA: hypothetical protein VGJ21_18010 [Terracidiphilus sp.]|jgi:hypothetical protein
MDLWTEFEGITIDSAFALKKLLQSEGRSAFFSTSNAKGEPVLIRIVECHFDEDEIQARWRGVQALGHPNFLRIEHSGQFLIEEDGITAVYAVFERVDANLGQVLERGRLSAVDAAQIGLSSASALEMLHTNGFVHEHIEARNIFAVGETVKMRSDCVRETPEGAAGLEARRRDVHDLVLILMQVLLGHARLTQASWQVTLPEPFDEVLRKGTSSEWGLAEIQAALAGVKGSKAPKPRILIAPEVRQAIPLSPADACAKPLSPEKHPETQKRAPALSGGVAHTVFGRQHPTRFDLDELAHKLRRLPLRGIAAGLLLCLVVLFGWMLLHALFSGSGHASAHSAASRQTPVTPSRTAPARRTADTPRTATSAQIAQPGSMQWRVVAFTYNRKDQAEKKASTLAQKYPDLRPQAFSPNGHAPWLVTVGGALERDQAYDLARRARTDGLPRDTYAQNYTTR